MNEGVQILIERVKTHPEEFVFEDDHPFKESKWRNIIQQYKDYLPKEDIEALQGAINAVIQEKFTAKVMEELLDPKVEEQLTLNPYSTSTGNVTLSGGTTQGLTLTSTGTGLTWANTATNTIQLGNQTLDEKTIEHMKAHLEYMKMRDKAEQEKKHKTLFGRLFNYS